MNFFGKGARAGRDSCSPWSPEMEKLRYQYVRFCSSWAVSEEQSKEEFSLLCAHELIEELALVENDGSLCLLVSTKPICLRNHRTSLLHDIGQMVIVMRRRPHAEVYFYNRTRVVRYCLSPNDPRSFHHPHVNESGRICSSFLDIIMTELAGGKVLSATEKSLAAVCTYGPDAPLCDISRWPEISENLEENINA